MGLDSVLERLEAVRSSGQSRFVARCPAHHDRTASLSIRQADDGRVLLHCFGGCDTRDVLHALNLELKDLYPEALTPFRASSKPRATTPKPTARGHDHAWLWHDLPDEILLKLEKVSTLPDFPLEAIKATLETRKTCGRNVNDPRALLPWVAGNPSPLEALADWIASSIRDVILENATVAPHTTLTSGAMVQSQQHTMPPFDPMAKYRRKLARVRGAR